MKKLLNDGFDDWREKRLEEFGIPEAIARKVLGFVEEHCQDSHMESDFWAAIGRALGTWKGWGCSG